ncbi:hypothetical protein M758_7G020800 [Ceratodon purpureus]|uniref:Chaperonin-like RbcX protein 2, chloroplastic n=1 Tax=Ceratodon purpureus TaxID=3225 RepID=A0A8T0H566_CERPU|nr:hypothetical protein KC19_7G021700 [Ceratodon purpureus]KAG0609880.1 hypothetical protein M758_7G020800 [Ceratodon purpureus]
MVGATLVGASMAGAVAAVTLTGPPCRCTCSEAAAAGVVRASRIKQQGHSCSSNQRKSSKQVHLFSSMTQAWQDSRLSARVLAQMVPCSTSDHHAPMVVDDLGGQYEDTFDDVEKHLLDYFTYKAVKTVLAQLSEMNPPEYAWFYNFVVNNKPQDSKLFVRILVKERQELGERVMVTRLHLFNKWVKKYNHVQMHKAISDQNLELLRERLIQTVKLTDGDNIDRPPLRGMD